MDSIPTFRKIFVLYPRGLRTGGPEALHQLVDALRRQGQEAYLVPMREGASNPRVAAYEHYNAPEAAEVEDAPDNAVIVPEFAPGKLAQYRHAVRICWWLSIDNSALYREERQRTVLWPSERTLRTSRPVLALISAAKVVRSALRNDRLDLGGTLHLAQSDYAWSYLAIRADVRPSMVTDYTPLDVIEATPSLPPEQRRRAVAYNPTKASAVTRLLAEQMPDVEFVPIVRMTREQVAQTLSEVAVYLDLGYHPGKDRMPREAAMCGAVTLVARRGSGAFAADVPLPWEHTIEITPDVLEASKRAIRTVLADLPAQHAAQEPYRRIIAAERETFFDEVRSTLIEGRFGAGIPWRR